VTCSWEWEAEEESQRDSPVPRHCASLSAVKAKGKRAAQGGGRRTVGRLKPYISTRATRGRVLFLGILYGRSRVSRGCVVDVSARTGNVSYWGSEFCQMEVGLALALHLRWRRETAQLLSWICLRRQGERRNEDVSCASKWIASPYKPGVSAAWRCFAACL